MLRGRGSTGWRRPAGRGSGLGWTGAGRARGSSEDKSGSAGTHAGRGGGGRDVRGVCIFRLNQLLPWRKQPGISERVLKARSWKGEGVVREARKAVCWSEHFAFFFTVLTVRAARRRVLRCGKLARRVCVSQSTAPHQPKPAIAAAYRRGSRVLTCRRCLLSRPLSALTTLVIIGRLQEASSAFGYPIQVHHPLIQLCKPVCKPACELVAAIVTSARSQGTVASQ